MYKIFVSVTQKEILWGVVWLIVTLYTALHMNRFGNNINEMSKTKYVLRTITGISNMENIL